MSTASQLAELWGKQQVKDVLLELTQFTAQLHAQLL